jgi:anti-sigma regulatory factor (Ser/Thr protein kinase)
MTHLADTAELIVSELVTNAVQASERLPVRASTHGVPVVRVWLASDLTSLVIHVWDASDRMPARRQPSLDDEGGRGLMLADSLSKEWGAYATAHGKVVWATVGPHPSEPRSSNRLTSPRDTTTEHP